MLQQHGIQTLRPPSSAHESSGRTRRIKCLFTTHLTKKRKTWSDGTLKVYFAGGCFQCCLLDSEKLRESVLATRPLEKAEVEKLKKNEDVELEFENYLVSITVAPDDYDKVGPPLKLPKFVPPTYRAPPPKPDIPQIEVSRPMNSISFNANVPYKVSADELDEIWDRDQPFNNANQKPPSNGNTSVYGLPPSASATESARTQHHDVSKPQSQSLESFFKPNITHTTRNRDENHHQVASATKSNQFLHGIHNMSSNNNKNANDDDNNINNNLARNVNANTRGASEVIDDYNRFTAPVCSSSDTQNKIHQHQYQQQPARSVTQGLHPAHDRTAGETAHPAVSVSAVTSTNSGDKSISVLSSSYSTIISSSIWDDDG